MGLLGTIVKGVTGPFRGIGYLAQGKVRKAIGAFGDTAKVAAPILGATVVGAPVAALVGGAGGAASKWGSGDSNLGHILTSGVEGAATGAAGAGVKSLLAGKAAVPGAIDAASDVASASAPSVADVVPGMATGIEDLGGATNALSVAAKAPKAMGIGSKILGFASKNPAISAQLLGTAANTYGAAKEGAVADRQLNLQEEAMRRGWAREEALDPYRDALRNAMLEMARKPRQTFADWQTARG